MTVTLSNPPINLETDAMMADLDFTLLEGDRETKVVIFRRDTPSYFMAHFDIAQLRQAQSHEMFKIPIGAYEYTALAAYPCIGRKSRICDIRSRQL